MQAKTTRAFRTISEAGEELDLQPHVLRFWESKFPQIKPIKRGGGRRFYRPEDIEFIRGIKILLHDEKHPIKDVQKLIRVKGAARIVELGQSVEKAAKERDVADTVLIPERIQKAEPEIRRAEEDRVVPFTPRPEPEPEPEPIPEPEPEPAAAHVVEYVEEEGEFEDEAMSAVNRLELEEALERLTSLRRRWEEFKNPA
ncbi:MAG: MerR family transcriptional regulator [Hellea sp.]